MDGAIGILYDWKSAQESRYDSFAGFHISEHASSLKDAVVQFGSNCTGEVVSSQGLVLTNHHCGYSQIQALSTLERNYLDSGFWARSLKPNYLVPD